MRAYSDATYLLVRNTQRLFIYNALTRTHHTYSCATHHAYLYTTRCNMLFMRNTPYTQRAYSARSFVRNTPRLLVRNTLRSLTHNTLTCAQHAALSHTQCVAFTHIQHI